MFSVGHRSLLFRRGLFRKRVGWRGVKVSVSFVRAPPKFDAEKIVTSPRTLSLPQLWRALFPTSVGGASTGKQSEKVGRWVRSSVRSRRRRREMYRGRERRSAGTYFLPPSNYGSTVPWSAASHAGVSPSPPFLCVGPRKKAHCPGFKEHSPLSPPPSPMVFFSSSAFSLLTMQES